MHCLASLYAIYDTKRLLAKNSQFFYNIYCFYSYKLRVSGTYSYSIKFCHFIPSLYNFILFFINLPYIVSLKFENTSILKCHKTSIFESAKIKLFTRLFNLSTRKRLRFYRKKNFNHFTFSQNFTYLHKILFTNSQARKGFTWIFFRYGRKH